ncbi:ferredoxin [Actinoplanes sp. NBC_00393]|uniref:ferredoxin n=1 Tax=Actinoplanes sp. NBC_00393 TaxID=2975953 RepID=UPI002E21B5C7
MHVSADQDKCCGAGQCVLLAPEVFDQREEDGIVTVLDPEPPGQLHDVAREAAAVCPTSAISIRE